MPPDQTPPEFFCAPRSGHSSPARRRPAEPVGTGAGTVAGGQSRLEHEVLRGIGPRRASPGGPADGPHPGEHSGAAGTRFIARCRCSSDGAVRRGPGPVTPGRGGGAGTSRARRRRRIIGPAHLLRRPPRCGESTASDATAGKTRDRVMNPMGLFLGPGSLPPRVAHRAADAGGRDACVWESRLWYLPGVISLLAAPPDLRRPVAAVARPRGAGTRGGGPRPARHVERDGKRPLEDAAAGPRLVLPRGRRRPRRRP